ncbi:MAG: multidrug DMT transporter permease [Cytophagales bacterium]|nr:multidrug DMT transporter permease [Cytophagales bacterium]
MIFITSYPLAVLFCVLAMIFWGSWQNSRNFINANWRFELFYWDFITGVLIMSFLAAVTVGSMGTIGHTFWQSCAQADYTYILYAMLGGLLWNIGTLLLVAGISISGMATAFPVGGGIAWLLGILVNYIGAPEGNLTYIVIGGVSIAVAIIICAISYKKLLGNTSAGNFKGVVLAAVAGVLIAFFYRFVAISLVSDYANPEEGKLTPLTGVFYFCLGAFLSTFVINPVVMMKPFKGEPVTFSQYFAAPSKNHLIGIIGGMVWCMGMVFSFMASGTAGYTISYAVSNGAPVVAALWGILVWKEFNGAPKGTNTLLIFMFLFYLIGLGLIIMAK